jgi:hypothetical protein
VWRARAARIGCLAGERARGGRDMGVRSSGPRNGGGVDGVTRGTVAEEGPGRQPRPSHGGHRQHVAAHVASREMSERES